MRVATSQEMADRFEELFKFNYKNFFFYDVNDKIMSVGDEKNIPPVYFQDNYEKLNALWRKYNYLKELRSLQGSITPNDVCSFFPHPTWTQLECTECNQYFDRVLLLKKDSLCKACLGTAITLMEQP